jgi:ATP-dependent Clp protease ATP-binding subunit ClpA
VPVSPIWVTRWAGVRDAVEAAIGRGKASPSGRIPFTPRAKKVLELSLREALQHKHGYIGTEHILLGMLREGQGRGAHILADKHPLEETRNDVWREWSRRRPARRRARAAR